MVIETERLRLREFITKDSEAIHEYASNPLVVKHMLWGPNSIDETQSYLNTVIEMQEKTPRQGFELAVILKESGQLIGGSGIHIYSPGIGELGYCFQDHHWGRGFASEAASALLSFGFGELKLHRIFATCRPDNIGSAKVMQKIGMRYEGHLREHMWHNKDNRWVDSHQYSILEQDYKQPL
ncbi:GNAT family N-acetyltransferase [Paenibacillus radicis (ex Gao et al. 2016)]|uniref:Ribosomal-protein-serine acetyltransferase n=1 Tax=Paenibacillus radicis (ex Gao et al. 2016) TaxID=1737354 RepID=A0A917LZW0_9BACL|nr:GNAT family N-acetyltransferase [Paenibacillus radicis (ex Gao et al. 2016)]GGG68230.1 ribosomal-protein-serine acetyltransferase [Paenibacillus radicis (ex Gao et al. 2016)]